MGLGLFCGRVFAVMDAVTLLEKLPPERRALQRASRLLPGTPDPPSLQTFLGLTFFSLIRMVAHCLKSQWIVPLGISYAHRDIGNDDVKTLPGAFDCCCSCWLPNVR
ncbi:hypothetical protein D3C76_1140940 [compost metagenome]